jgi:hypothetical protein
MVSITPCCKDISGFMRLFCAVFLALMLGAPGASVAQTVTEVSQLRVERAEDELLVSAQVLFDLPSAVEDALLKGVAMYFAVEAEILRERWYWYDRRVTLAERRLRLAYMPLTRRWRLNVTSGVGSENNVGLALNQNFDTLSQALASVKRVSGWKIADAGDIEPGGKYKLELRFRLDLSQLPRPFQIGAIGKDDWDIATSMSMPLSSHTLR